MKTNSSLDTDSTLHKSTETFPTLLSFLILVLMLAVFASYATTVWTQGRTTPIPLPGFLHDAATMPVAQLPAPVEAPGDNVQLSFEPRFDTIVFGWSSTSSRARAREVSSSSVRSRGQL